MEKDKIPSSKAIACFIKKHSPANSKCIAADFVSLNGMSILAWVIDTNISKEQGYYKALYSKITDGKFGYPGTCMPCRYYDEENGNRIFTSSPFVQNPDTKAPLISVLDASKDDSRVMITLSCKGKAFSQVCVRERD